MSTAAALSGSLATVDLVKELFWDTETTGLPEWKEPSDSEKQPHLVEIAGILSDNVNRDVIESCYYIIKPDGWEISQEMTDIHGISQERAMDEGVPELEALEGFMALYAECDLRVAHNTTFDNRMIRIALKRYLPDLIADEEWKDKARYFCTWMRAKKIMGGKDGHKLDECYQHFINAPLVGNHSAMADTQACREIYYTMLDQYPL
jgi:DNA polymerase-3 subunit epsilon